MKRQNDEERVKDGNLPHTAEAEEREGGVKNGIYGKFKDAESLLSAYDSLEAEFTRRSQRLRELERAAERRETEIPSETSHGRGEVDGKAFLEAFPRAKEFSSRITALAVEADDKAAGNLERAYIRLLEKSIDEAKNKLGDENFLLEAVRANSAISSGIVKTYLKNLAGSKPTAAFGGGSALALPPKRPKNFGEAAEMTKNYLNEKGEFKW
ncbi:MAG: hypothetical protein IJS67_04650 [Clostridia bacterium]|nr:hypothetical protein [Clostridia bacterium]